MILFAYIAVFFFGQSRTNIGQAMNSTLSGGDVVLLNELSYRFSGPSREDVISFKLNGSEDTHSYIRRVIGLPGETIQIIDGMIYINGSVYLETQGFPQMENAGMVDWDLTNSRVWQKRSSAVRIARQLEKKATPAIKSTPMIR